MSVELGTVNPHMPNIQRGSLTGVHLAIIMVATAMIAAEPHFRPRGARLAGLIALTLGFRLSSPDPSRLDSMPEEELRFRQCEFAGREFHGYLYIAIRFQSETPCWSDRCGTCYGG
jgi:hypothetical protein